ncbi:MAG: hypothetical protein HQM08_18080 [Candidatus Riflebacteria bacterium]|nr:hypothetical protein [Candidatus Riflebacteria bacterium]
MRRRFSKIVGLVAAEMPDLKLLAEVFTMSLFGNVFRMCCKVMSIGTKLKASFQIAVLVALFLVAIITPASAQNFTDSTISALGRMERRIGPPLPAQLPTADNVAQEKARQAALSVLNALRQRLAAINPGSLEQQRMGLERLGFSSAVAQKIAQLHPRLADEILAWGDVDPAGAKARTVYRGLALNGGIAGFNPSLDSGLGHPVHAGSIYIADDWHTARDFAFNRAEKSGKPVLIAIQVPQLMVGTSPLQMGDSTWPMIRATDLPDPNHPDLSAFILGYAELSDDSRQSATPPNFLPYPPK